MPHGNGHCKGGPRGVPWNGKLCRVCWLKNNQGMSAPSVPITHGNHHALPTVSSRPPCIHLGPIVEYASLPGCNKHVYDCAVHDRCKTYQWDSKPMACCAGCKQYAAIESKDLTIAITYWNRPAALERLLASIKTYLPNIPYIVEDTGGNLSAGRNRLYAKVQTKYLIMMEEDFVVLPSTPKGIADAVSILDYDQAIAGVGGVAAEPSRGNVRWGHSWVTRNGRVHPTPSTIPLRSTPQGVKYRPCQLVLNWGVFRTEIFQRVPWDEDFPIMEHQFQFYRMNQAGYQFAFYSPLRVDHIRDRPTQHYREQRYRTFTHLVKQKLGFQFGREV